MIIRLTTKGGDTFYIHENGGVTKQRARALNVFTKTVERRIAEFKTGEWYTNHGKGCKFDTEASPAGALGRPRKVKARKRVGRPAGKRGPGRPKGSKNKPKVAVEVAAAPAQATTETVAAASA